MHCTSLFFLCVVACLLLLSNSNLVDGSRDIPITKCCENDTFYWQGFDSCRNGSEHPFFISWPPPVYSEDSILIDYISAVDDFNITTAKHDCPDGQIAVSTTKFKFLINGLLRLEDGRNYQVGQFCLSQVFGSDEEIVARFCAPDPCIEANLDSAGCLRKCCPIGMALNFINNLPLCQSSLSPSFNVQFKNKLGESIDQSLSSYVVRDGVAPKCIFGIDPLSEAFNESFYVLPDTQIYVPGNIEEHHKMPSDYCIDTDGADEVN